MALYFAELDSNNMVVDVVVVSEDDAPDEATGIAFLKNLTGKDKWIQTFENGEKRKRNAGIRYTYDSVNDVCYAPQPYPSWIMNTTSWEWEAPVAPPANNEDLWWDEPTQSWVKEYSS